MTGRTSSPSRSSSPNNAELLTLCRRSTLELGPCDCMEDKDQDDILSRMDADTVWLPDAAVSMSDHTRMAAILR